MSILTRAARCHIPEDRILYSHHHDNYKSYFVVFIEIFSELSVPTGLFIAISILVNRRFIHLACQQDI
jgi:hypothetical protein